MNQTDSNNSGDTGFIPPTYNELKQNNRGPIISQDQINRSIHNGNSEIYQQNFSQFTAPRDYLCLSIISIFANICCGLIALGFSLQARNKIFEQSFSRARTYSTLALIFSIVSFVSCAFGFYWIVTFYNYNN
ncbi:unnamed protein product [Brachionus calyciflorus]|uniref:Uncharacterized protein n=1 Tax=Brachionus calyciflorus TaxID=104777 RepID=A0A814F0S3_9BILA|nr:unnamed protein product [Brachionus calyciflorus]